ncbi:MAG TPA: hypothetical protein VJL31_14905 [Gemmatimonadales bacterium]|jgi:hypothetical protein|nr:hypothetical protein [Gemmatimonadales bacterium]
MQASSVSGAVSGVVAVAVCAATLVAQQPVSIQFGPGVGSAVRTITSSRGTMVFHEINEAAQRIGDSVMGEMTSQAGITHRILERQPGGFVVEVRYDSLKTRARLLGQPTWKEDVLLGTGEDAVRVPMDVRLRPAEGTGGGLPADPVANGGIASWRGVELPDRPVSPGDTWTVTTVYRLPAQLGQLLDIVIRDSLIAAATVRLDSVTVRPADSLMYLTVQQTLPAVTFPAVDAGDDATVELVGSQAASLVWSTGWNAFVSGASQARLVGRLQSRNASGTPRLAEIHWTLATRLQVRL